MSDIYSLSEAAILTGFCSDFITKAVEQGKLQAVKPANDLRFKYEELREFVRRETLTVETAGINYSW